MFVFEIEDPNTGLRDVIESLKQNGIRQDSRNGPVVRFPRPVCLQYGTPQRRILSSPLRDANHVFHLFETMWMFAGLQDLKPLLTYNAGMAQYSDDGRNLRGTAYGHRWRSYHWADQLDKAVEALLASPDDRRVVMTMWDPYELGIVSKDFACNLQVIFGTRPDPQGTGHVLDMTVTNRSNDLIYGAMGSNMFHFSMLHEYVAMLAGLRLGTYYQVSTNLHLYTENATAKRCWEGHEQLQEDHVSQLLDTSLSDLRLTQNAKPIAEYVYDSSISPQEPYLAKVVAPLVEAYRIFKLKSRLGFENDAWRVRTATQLAQHCHSAALGTAAAEWFHRRAKPEPLTGAGIFEAALHPTEAQ